MNINFPGTSWSLLPRLIPLGSVFLALFALGLVFFIYAITRHTQQLAKNTENSRQEVHERQQTEKLLSKKVEREKDLNRAVGIIRNSLTLNNILTTAAAEIGHLLETDRTDLFEYRPQQSMWVTVETYRQNSNLKDIPGIEIPDAGNTIAPRLKNLEIVRWGDAETNDDEINQELCKLFPGAWLLVPLHFQGLLWGSLALARHPRSKSSWSPLEEELAQRVAEHVAIAIHQAQLYRQLNQTNSILERQVQLHNLEFQRAMNFEATLKRITDKVRDSLDQNQILQTVVKELVETLEVECCDTVLYNGDRLTATVAYEATQTGISSHGGSILHIAEFPEVFQHVEQGNYCAFCQLQPSWIFNQRAILVCPIIDNHGLLGDLWLFKPALSSFEDLEIRLVEQVSNQCAIAIRQAQLYQAAQKQVTELEKLNYLKDNFLNTISHELRTPVSSIKMAIEMLEILVEQDGGFRGNLEKLKPYVQIVLEQAQKEEELINNLLDITHLEARTEALSLATVKLQYWLPYLIETFQERISKQQQQLRLEISPDLPEIVTDLDILERIILELLNNACKYTPPGEFIRVTAFLQPQLLQRQETNILNFEANQHPHLQISIANSGIEIPAVELERIFDRFYRIPNLDPWQHEGTGLGLALVKKLIHSLGGTIKVESNSEFTCFTIDLVLNS